MHFEPPEKVIRSLKEFASHYAMIVVSILTALALEHLALSMHHASEAKRAKVEIEQEIRANQAALADSIKATNASLASWNALLDKSVMQLKSGTASNEERMALLDAAAKDYGDFMPALSTTAWDSALSSQAANYLDHADLKRYSELYANLKIQAHYMSSNLDGSTGNFSDLMFALKTGKADPLEVVRILNWRARVMAFSLSNMVQINEALKAAIAGKPIGK